MFQPKESGGKGARWAHAVTYEQALARQLAERDVLERARRRREGFSLVKVAPAAPTAPEPGRSPVEWMVWLSWHGRGRDLGLTRWETSFAESIATEWRDRRLSTKQVATMERIGAKAKAHPDLLEMTRRPEPAPLSPLEALREAPTAMRTLAALKALGPCAAGELVEVEKLSPNSVAWAMGRLLAAEFAVRSEVRQKGNVVEVQYRVRVRHRERPRARRYRRCGRPWPRPRPSRASANLIRGPARPDPGGDLAV